MISGSVREMIYFPTSYDGRKAPCILYVNGAFEDEYKGSPILEETQSGRFGFFKKARCQPHSEELMEKINKLVLERDAINLALDALRTQKKRTK